MACSVFGRLGGVFLLGLAWLGLAVPSVGAVEASIELEQRSTEIIARVDGFVVDPQSWAGIWAANDQTACHLLDVDDQSDNFDDNFVTTTKTGAELSVPLLETDQFVCLLAQTEEGVWLYSDWLAIRVGVIELTVNQRHQFVTITANQTVVKDSWRGQLTADSCSESTSFEPLPPDMVRLSSEFQLVLEVPKEADGHWLCLEAFNRSQSARAFVSHRLSRLNEKSPVVAISHLGNQLRASTQTDWPQEDWYFFKSLSQPNCHPDPIAGPGKVPDPLFDDWTPGQELTVQVVGDEEIWVCFIVFSPPDDFGNRLVGYGLYQVVNRPVGNLRGLIWLVALNGFIVCVGSAVGILLYRNHPDKNKK